MFPFSTDFVFLSFFHLSLFLLVYSHSRNGYFSSFIRKFISFIRFYSRSLVFPFTPFPQRDNIFIRTLASLLIFSFPFFIFIVPTSFLLFSSHSFFHVPHLSFHRHFLNLFYLNPIATKSVFCFSSYSFPFLLLSLFIFLTFPFISSFHSSSFCAVLYRFYYLNYFLISSLLIFLMLLSFLLFRSICFLSFSSIF